MEVVLKVTYSLPPLRVPASSAIAQEMPYIVLHLSFRQRDPHYTCVGFQKMNTGTVKQLFLEIARELPEPGFQAFKKLGPGPVQLTEPLVIRNDFVLYGDIARKFHSSMEQLAGVVKSDPEWSRNDVEGLVVQCLKEVAKTPLEVRGTVIRVQADQLMSELQRPPSNWQVDLSIFGMDLNCAGLKFGKLEFVSERVKSPIAVPGLTSAGEVQALFARASVDAASQEAAHARARGIVEQHACILNALCARNIPSLTRIVHSLEPPRSMSMSRTAQSKESNSDSRFHFQNSALPVSRSDYEAFLEQRGGKNISNMLATPSPLAKRILSGLEIAGSACTERRPHLSFLMFAIALESLVLGEQNKTELTFQLSSRVAHLLSKDIRHRREIVKDLHRLYRLRSAIVHSGETEVTDSELEEIENICMSALITVSTDPAFELMQSIGELDNWFRDRILGSEGGMECQVPQE